MTASPTISECVFESNSAASFGGAIACMFGSSPVIASCTFVGNMAESGAAIYCLTESSANIVNCEFIENESTDKGGAVAIYVNSAPSFANCLFSANTALTSGGAVYAEESTPLFKSCTFSGNTGTETGGAYHGANSAMTTINSIFWNNAPEQIFFSDITPTVTYSMVQGGFAGIGNITGDPLFMAGVNGGFYLSNQEAGQHDTSVCVNAGSTSAENVRFNLLSNEITMNQLTTRTDEAVDTGTVDLGYHYFPSGYTPPTVIPTEVPTIEPTEEPKPTETITPSPTQTAPTETPTPIQTKTPTQAPSMTPPPTPSPTHSPTVPFTATPYATATITPSPTPGTITVSLEMPAIHFSYGDLCWLTLSIENSQQPLDAVPLFVILEVYGDYWFWDNWTQNFDYVLTSVPLGRTEIPIIPSFNWPDTGASAIDGLLFWGALTDATFTSVLGGTEGIGSWQFGYGPK